MENYEGTACELGVRELRCQKDCKESSKVGWCGKRLGNQSGVAHPSLPEHSDREESVDILFDNCW